MFWAGGDLRETIRELKEAGARCGQLGVPGGTDLQAVLAAAAALKICAADAESFPLVTVFAAFAGESYADILAVQRTVGFIPRATREERLRRTLEISDLAAALGVPAIALHAGFVPDDLADLDYLAVREMVRRVADYAAARGQVFALETGQEPAPVLLRFIQDVARPNVRINFDPANMILYGSGDPIEALDVLGPYVVSVHAKDGDWPPKDKPGALGSERPLGQGSVGMPRFIAKLKAIGFRGPLCIEREIEDHDQCLRDIRAAVALLENLRAAC
jgi:sugar phosphate isomerase/epimerase